MPWIIAGVVGLLVAFFAANEYLRYRGSHSTLPGACTPALIHETDSNGKSTTRIGCAP